MEESMKNEVSETKMKRIIDLMCALPGTESYEEKLRAAVASGMTQTDFIRAHALVRAGGIGFLMLEEADMSADKRAAIPKDRSEGRPTGTKVVLQATRDKVVFQVHWEQ